MKKKYTKPYVMFEDFSLNTSIAGTCESIVNNSAKGSCAVIGTGGIAMFDEEVLNNACEFTPTGMGGAADQWDGFCYHVPTEYNNLFNS